MKRLYLISAVLLTALMWGCTQPTDWHDATDNVPPGPVTGIEVLNQSGGAQITYTLPSDLDVMGAKVVYSLTADGEQMERYASTNTVELEGFGDTNEHSIMVYAIDRSGNVSTGTSATIRPLTPPVIQTRRTLKAGATFGGVLVKWDNPMQKNMAVSLYVQDSVSNEMIFFDTYFFDSANGSTAFRNLPFKEQQFRVELHDRWNNYAAPLDTILTPLSEMRLPGRQINPPMDIWTQYGFSDKTFLDRGDIANDLRLTAVANRFFRLVHNGDRVSESGETYWHPGYGFKLDDYIPGETSALPFPMYFTIDMGRKAFYSRMNFFTRNRSPSYSAPMPCDFEIWGSNDPKPLEADRLTNLQYWTQWPQANGTDAWKNDWVKIATCTLPKYTDGMALSADEITQYTTYGYDFDMDPEVTQPFRYLRWVIYDTNTGQKELMIDEIKFWGAYAD